MSAKRCEACGKGTATVRFTEVEDGAVQRHALCRACAEARGLLDVPPAAPVAVVQELLETIPAAEKAGERPAEAAPPGLVCPTCGIAFGTFRQEGRLGCPDCYTAFELQLLPLLRQLHGAVRHLGKAPRGSARAGELRQRVTDLRGELDRAVRAEEYERAARLRDEIRALEHEQSATARETSPQGREEGQP